MAEEDEVVSKKHESTKLSVRVREEKSEECMNIPLCGLIILIYMRRSDVNMIRMDLIDLTKTTDSDELKAMIKADCKLNEMELREKLAEIRRENEQIKTEMKSLKDKYSDIENISLMDKYDGSGIDKITTKFDAMDSEFTAIAEEFEKYNYRWTGAASYKVFDIDEYSEKIRVVNRKHLTKVQKRLRVLLKKTDGQLDQMRDAYLECERELDKAILKRKNRISKEDRELQKKCMRCKNRILGAMKNLDDMDTDNPNVIMKDERIHMLWQISMIMRYTFRGYFGIPYYKKWGHFLDKYMSSQIHEYAYDVGYPSDLESISVSTGRLYCVAISSDGRYLFSGGQRHTIMVHDLVTKEMIKLMNLGDTVDVLVYYPGYLIAGLGSSEIQLWNPYTMKSTMTLVGHRQLVNSVRMNDTLDKVVSSSNDRSIRIWNPSNGECLRIFEGHKKAVNSVHWIGDRILSGSADKSIQMWNDQYNEKSILTKTVTKSVSDLRINCDGSRIACVCQESSIIIYNWPEMEELSTIKQKSFQAQFHPFKAELLAVTDTEKHSVKIFDIEDGECLKVFSHHSDWINNLCWTPDGRKLISVSDDQKVYICDTLE